MRKTIFFLMCFASQAVHAQFNVSASYDLSDYKVLDTAKCVVTYSMNFKYHPDDEQYISDTRMVQVGKRIVKDYSMRTFYYDSLTTVNNRKGLDSPMNQEPGFGYEIFNHYSCSKSLIAYRMFLSAGVLYWFDDDDTPQWQLYSDSVRTILGYACSKASTFYKGRRYYAWYTLDIPVNAGPYRFSGLPGLILRVEEENKMYVWEMEGFVRSSTPICEYKYEIYKKCKKEDAAKTIKRMFDAPMNFLTSSGVRMMVRRPNGSFGAPANEVSIPYEDIEKP